MKTLKLFLFTLASLSIASCNTVYYQVYEAKSSELIQKDNSMVFENEDCKVSYNLWSNGGSMAFIFENKTDKDLFVDLSQSFFIKNGGANDYFQNRTYETRAYESVSLGYSVTDSYLNPTNYWESIYNVPITTSFKAMAKAKAGASLAVTTKEPDFICVPAKSYKVFAYYKIKPSLIKTCDKNFDQPRTDVVVKTYNENNTPLKFKNRIAYSFENNKNSLKHIDNSFWLASIKNYSKKSAIEKEKVQQGCSSFKVKREFFKIGGPNQFYVPYTNRLE